MVNRKDRRHSGYFTPIATISKKELIDNNIFINPIYDDWKNYKDGFRDWFRDFKKIKKIGNKFRSKLYLKRIQMNKKQKKLLSRRRAKLEMKFAMNKLQRNRKTTSIIKKVQSYKIL